MPELDAPFFHALARSVVQAALVVAVSLALGWPTGVACGLWTFPGKRLLTLLLALPLLLPSFLIAIGFSLLNHRISGLGGSIWTFTCAGTPLVFFATVAATRTVTAGQADAARLAGGERMLFRLSLQGTWTVASIAAVLAGIITLADVGPGQILGWHTAASEILGSFAARYDRVQATWQAFTITCVGAVCSWPLIWRITPMLGTHLLTRDTKPFAPSPSPALGVVIGSLGFVTVILPLTGLFFPLLVHEWPIFNALKEVNRTSGDTIFYACLSATFSIIIGFGIAALTYKSPTRLRWTITSAIGLLALPPVLPALWLIPWSNRITVALALAFRCFPIALLFALRAFGSMPSSWRDAAKVHGVPPLTFEMRVTIPWLCNWAAPAFLLCGLIATAEVGVVLLLHPPGHGSLPLAIFTIMANAPEALVAMLCLLYVTLAAITVFSVSLFSSAK